MSSSTSVAGASTSSQAAGAADDGDADGPVVQIALTTGERLRGVLIEQSSSHVVLVHPVLGRLNIPMDGVQAVIEPAGTTPTTCPDTPANEPAPAQTQPTRQSTPAAAPDAPAQPSGHAPESADPPAAVDSPWSFELEIGADASHGNSENASLRSTFVADYETPDNSTTFDMGYRLRTSEGDRTENRFTTGVISEWHWNGKPWNTFVEGRYDRAEFQSWEHRVSGGGGLGYHLAHIQQPDPDTGEPGDYFDAHLRFGFGGRRDFGTESPEDLVLEGILGGRIDWHITPRQRLTARSTFYPALNAFGEFRVVSGADWTIDINHLDGISLNFGIEHDHESDTDPGIENDDVSAYASLKIAF